MISMLELLQAIELKRKELFDKTPFIRVGDIIKVQTCHDPEPCCYEVSSIYNGDYISQPASFRHRRSDIIAVYRFDGKDYKCIWEATNENG